MNRFGPNQRVAAVLMAVFLICGVSFLASQADAKGSKKKFSDCAALVKSYKKGVASSKKAKKKSKAVVNPAVYRANKKLDTNRNGIACDRGDKVSTTTTVAPTTTVTLTCATGGTCAVGAVGPGGGIVFYVNPSGFACGPTLASTCKYLEAAPTTGTAAWADAQYRWYAYGSSPANTLIGSAAQGTAIGTGYKNTLAMVALDNSSGYTGTVSRAYRGPNNLTDWYVPSKDELNELWLARSTAGLGSFIPNWYASSTEFDAGNNWVQGLDSSGQQGNFIGKDWLPYVRPIRAF